MIMKNIKSLKCLFCVILCAIFIVLSHNTVNAAEGSPEVIILSDTNQMKGDYPVLEECVQDQTMLDLIDNSFIKTSLELYQNTLENLKASEEPFYLVFKQNSGCYAKMGFYIKKNGSLINKTNIPYIEMSNAKSMIDPEKFDSITQILPHEMGHVLTILACGDYTEASELENMEMHYSDVITDYKTAFNEGFAEHFEIISRTCEKNETIRKGIEADYLNRKKKFTPIISRADRDYTIPFRLDYYRVASILWFDQNEGLKRNDITQSGECIYQNKTIRMNNVQKSLVYKNTGLKKDKALKRSYAQSLSTESVISRFFVLMNKNSTLPLIEQYSEIIRILNKYLYKDKRPALIQFVKGYITEHPDQKETVSNIFKEATGYEFTEEYAPNIWLLTENGSMNMALDPFGTIKYPFKTININTCGVENLININGISKTEAEKIISYRDHIGYYKTSDEFKDITGIKPNTLTILNNSLLGSKDWSMEKVSELYSSMGSLNFDMKKLLLAGLGHLVIKALAIFIIFFAVYFLLVLRKSRKYVKVFFTQFFKFILFVTTGLVAASLPMISNLSLHPVVLFGLITIVLEAIIILIFHKDRIKIKNSMISTMLLSCIIIYSLF